MRIGPNGFQALSIERDIAYGPDPRHRLDIHLPDTALGAGAQVPLFVHGGGYAWGDKCLEKLPYHATSVVGPPATAWSGSP